jgi:hypothetical protein
MGTHNGGQGWGPGGSIKRPGSASHWHGGLTSQAMEAAVMDSRTVRLAPAVSPPVA